jgi:hypothetical protein
METSAQPAASAVTENMARAFGLRRGVPIDEKLARLLARPGSRCVERFVYSRGLCALYVGGVFLDSVGEAGLGKQWLLEKAERLPELPHLRVWAENLENNSEKSLTESKPSA